MKSVIVLHFLAGLVLTAPQQEPVACSTKKSFQDHPTDYTDCFKSDNSFPTLIPSEKCAGTLGYCLRGFYKRPENGENCTSSDECLEARYIDPALIGGQPVENEADYYDGVNALMEAFSKSTMYRISKDRKEMEEYRSKVREYLDTAHKKLRAALSSTELWDKINTDIKAFKERLSKHKEKETLPDEIHELRQWLRRKTTEQHLEPLVGFAPVEVVKHA